MVASSYAIRRGLWDKEVVSSATSVFEAGAWVKATLWGGEVTSLHETESVPAWTAPWFDMALAEVQDLTTLRPDWDSYQGRPVSRPVAAFVVDFLRQVVPDEESLPSVVPMPDGGISLEWHKPWVDLVVEVPAEGHASVFYSNDRNGDSWERDISTALWSFDEILRAVTAE